METEEAMALQDFEEEYYEEGGRRKKTWVMILIAAVILVVGIGIVMVVSYFFNNRCFNGYEIKNEMKRNDSNNVNYYYFDGNFLKYSRNGINAIDNEGKSLWNGGYEMKQPQIDIGGNNVVVADVTGKQFYVYNGQDEGVSMETTLPIVRAKVSEQGIVAALLEDSDSNVLNIYNPYSSTDKLLVEIPTNVSEEGYPLDFDISPDGKSVVASYMVVSGTTVENKVSFYNFTAVGQDKNTLVGGKSFGDQMISQIRFTGSDRVAVFYENGFSVFGGMKQPEIEFEKTFKKQIRSAACSDDHVAIVCGDAEDEKQTLHVYTMTGREILNREIDYEYSDMQIYSDEIVFSGAHHCNILRLNGKDKWNADLDTETDGVYPTGNSGIYTLITEQNIQKIQLVMK